MEWPRKFWFPFWELIRPKGEGAVRRPETDDEVSMCTCGDGARLGDDIVLASANVVCFFLSPPALPLTLPMARCTRWFLPLLLLPLPTAPPYFLVLFLFSLTMHAKPWYVVLALWFAPAEVVTLAFIASSSSLRYLSRRVTGSLFRQIRHSPRRGQKISQPSPMPLMRHCHPSYLIQLSLERPTGAGAI